MAYVAWSYGQEGHDGASKARFDKWFEDTQSRSLQILCAWKPSKGTL